MINVAKTFTRAKRQKQQNTWSYLYDIYVTLVGNTSTLNQQNNSTLTVRLAKLL